MHLTVITKKDFAKMCSVSPQAISFAIKAGRVIQTVNGKINTSTQKNIAYYNRKSFVRTHKKCKGCGTIKSLKEYYKTGAKCIECYTKITYAKSSVFRERMSHEREKNKTMYRNLYLALVEKNAQHYESVILGLRQRNKSKGEENTKLKARIYELTHPRDKNNRLVSTRKSHKKYTSELRDGYVKKVLSQQGCSVTEITPELLEVKKIQLLGFRKIKTIIK